MFFLFLKNKIDSGSVLCLSLKVNNLLEKKPGHKVIFLSKIVDGHTFSRNKISLVFFSAIEVIYKCTFPRLTKVDHMKAVCKIFFHL